MSADIAGVLSVADVAQARVREDARPATRNPQKVGAWTPENFAREQIRGLVRQLFFSSAARTVRQVVFSSVEADTDVRGICRQVGEALALETKSSIAVVGKYPQLLEDSEWHHTGITEAGAKDADMSFQRTSTRVRGNLWLVPALQKDDDGIAGASLHSYLEATRGKFGYSIVEGRPVGESSEAIAMAQCADGIVLVLSARRTHRSAALRATQTLKLASARLLGTVLTDRMFPIPEGIYRRL